MNSEENKTNVDYSKELSIEVESNIKEKSEKSGIKIVEKSEMIEDKRTLADIELDKITVSDTNPRKLDVEKDINILIESMRKYGLMTPIEVRRVGSGDFYEVPQGQRRVMAARSLGWTKIRAWILPDEIPIQDDSERSFREQMDRLDLSPIDRSRVINELLDKYDDDWTRLSEILNRSVVTLKNWAEFGNVPEKIQEMVSEKKIGEGYARKISRFSEVNPDELVKIAEKVGNIKDKEHRDAVVDYIKRQPKSTAEDIEKKFSTQEEELAINIIFSARIAKAIRDLSDARSEEPHEFVKSIIREYLEGKGVLNK